MKRTMIFILLSALMFIYAYAQEEEMTLEKIVVTSTRSTESIKNAPNDITVITEADIAMDKDKTIPDILREKAGITVKEYSAGSAKQANIDIRGFGETGLSNVLVMVDGRRVTQIDLSGTDWAQIPLADVERIEVIRGAASVFYGDNSSGGVINIITREGRGKPSLEITSETGSYSSYDNRLQYSGAYDNFNYYSLARHYESKGYRTNNAIKTNDFDVKLGYKPLDAFKAKLSMGYHQDEYGLPGALNDAQINSLGRRASVKPFDNAKSMDYFGNLMLENDLEEKGRFITDISMRVRQVKAKYISMSWRTDNYITTFGFTPKYVLDAPVLNRNNKLTLGIDLYDAHDHVTDGPLNSEANVVFINKKSLGAYVFDGFSLTDNFTLSSGYRYETARYNFDQVSTEINKQSGKRVFDTHVLSSGLNYIYDTKDSNAFFDFEQSFRFPLVDEFFSSFAPEFGGGLDMNLMPQRADNYEIGVRHNFNRNTCLGITLFSMYLDNEIYFDPLTFKNSNYDRTLHQGVEYEFKSRLWDRFNFFNNYTFTDARLRKGLYPGNKIPAVPQHKWSAGFDLDLFKDLNFSLAANYVGERYFISDFKNRFPRMSAYTTVDIRLSYAKDNFSLYGGINNLFDEKYYEYAVVSNFSNTKNYYPAAGRNFIIGGSWKF